MKRNKLCVLVALAAAFAFVAIGCSSLVAGLTIAPATEIDAAPNIQPEELCQLDLSDSITVTSFDGRSVNWKKDSHADTLRTVVNIPAGLHSIVGNHGTDVIHAGGDSQAIYGLTIDFYFEAGRVYLLDTKTNWASIGGKGERAMFNISEVKGRKVKHALLPASRPTE